MAGGVHAWRHEGVKVRKLGTVAYVPTWKAMQAFNSSRDESTEDQLWLVELSVDDPGRGPGTAAVARGADHGRLADLPGAAEERC